MLDLKPFPRYLNDKKLMRRILFLEIEWQRACPDVNLQSELGWSYYWLTTNSKGAHYRDMTRFLSNWFKSCQIRENDKRISERRVTSDRREPPKYVEQKPDESEVMDASDFQKMKEALRDPKRATSNPL